MERSTEYALVIVLMVLIVLALWYFFGRKQPCASTADCKTGQVCTSGYCKSKAS